MTPESFNYFVKDPDALLDYSVDWTGWLCSDTIVTGTWAVPSGITEVGSSNTDEISTIWLSGGTNGQSYNITNRIITAGGRHDDRTITISVRDK